MKTEALNEKLRKLVRLCLNEASTTEEAAVALSRAKGIAAKYSIPLDSVLSESVREFKIKIDVEVRYTASPEVSPDDIEAFAAYASCYERIISLAGELSSQVADILNGANASHTLFYAAHWQDYLLASAEIMAGIPDTIYALQPPSELQRLHTAFVRYAALYSSRVDSLRDVVDHLRSFEVSRAHHSMSQVSRLSLQLIDIANALTNEASSVP